MSLNNINFMFCIKQNFRRLPCTENLKGCATKLYILIMLDWDLFCISEIFKTSV